MTAVYDRLRPMIVDVLDGSTLFFQAEKVTLDARLVDDLGADSLDVIELVMAAEDEFDIAVNDEDIESVKTVADAVALVERCIAEQAQ